MSLEMGNALLGMLLCVVPGGHSRGCKQGPLQAGVERPVDKESCGGWVGGWEM